MFMSRHAGRQASAGAVERMHDRLLPGPALRMFSKTAGPTTEVRSPESSSPRAHLRVGVLRAWAGTSGAGPVQTSYASCGVRGVKPASRSAASQAPCTYGSAALESARSRRKDYVSTWLWIVIIVIVAVLVLGYFGRGRMTR
jgi:cobalamin biosynthesis Mg chelatase CobN